MKTKADEYTDEIVKHLNQIDGMVSRSEVMSAVLTKIIRNTYIPLVLKKGVLEIVKEGVI